MKLLRSRWFAPLVLVVVCVATFWPGMRGPFIFDDGDAIPDNPYVKLLPSPRALWAPASSPLAGRPLVSLTFALNWAAHQEQVFGYHVVNLAIHALNAWLVFLIVTATLRRHAAPAPKAKGPPSRWAGAEELLGFSVALLWAVHPLVSEAVIYLTQRTELLFSTCLLISVLFTIKAMEQPTSRWRFAIIAAVLLGMASKETMVVAPVLLMLFERAFYFDSLKQAWSARKHHWRWLMATWGMTVVMVSLAPRSSSVGSMGVSANGKWVGQGISSWEYLLNQSIAVPRYFRQALAPYDLSLDYGEARAIGLTGAVVLGGLIVVALLGASVWAWQRWPRAAFLSAWAFAILGPTSSVVPIFTEVAAERRMYLPLLGVLLWLVVLLSRVVKPAQIALAFMVIALGGAAVTHARARDYLDPMTLWQGAVKALPGNSRAVNNLGQLQFKAGQVVASLKSFQAAIAIDERYGNAHGNVCGALFKLGRYAEAEKSCAFALELKPGLESAVDLAAQIASRLNKPADAKKYFLKAIELSPTKTHPHVVYGLWLLHQGASAEAIAEVQKALAIDSNDAEAHSALGGMLAIAGQKSEAEAHLQKGVSLDAKSATAWINLSKFEASEKRWAAAIEHGKKALELDDEVADGLNTLVFALMNGGQRSEAETLLRATLARRPESLEARRLLGVLLAQDNKFAEAKVQFLEILKRDPKNDEAARLVGECDARLKAP